MKSSGKLASGDLIEYRQLKAKAGGTDDGAGSRPPSRRFRAGEEVTCKIAGAISRGYQLSIEGISNSAFLRTDAKIEKEQKFSFSSFACIEALLFLRR